MLIVARKQIDYSTQSLNATVRRRSKPMDMVTV